MPDDVREELEERGVMDLYQERPFYQRNDYLAWIGRAARIETRRKRIEQMLDELEPLLPEGLEVNRQIFRQADFINLSVNNVIHALRDAAIIVSVSGWACSPFS